MNKKVTISKLFNTDLAEYGSYDNARSIASLVDGEKNAGRKIVWFSSDITVPKKISLIKSNIAEKSEYLHNEDALVDNIVGHAQQFNCSNHINILKPLSAVGTRTKPVAAAPRYASVKKADIYDYIYRKEDNPVLLHQEFEGTKIEPKFLVPTIPMLLVNGSGGAMGFGFAQNICPRQPQEIISKIKDYLKNGQFSMERIYPNFKGFKGKIELLKEEPEVGKTQWEFRGSYIKLNSTTIQVNEVVPYDDNEAYLKKLNNLVEKKIIKSYKDKSVGDKFDYEIKVMGSFWEEYANKDIEDILGLRTTDTENYTVVKEDNTIDLFANENSLLLYYCNIKIDYTEKRRQYQLQKIKDDIETNTWRMNFIQSVVNDEIIINKKSKSEILEQIDNHISEMGNSEEDKSKHLSIPLYSLTSEKITELQNKIKQLEHDYITLEKKTARDLWLKDIEDLETFMETQNKKK